MPTLFTSLFAVLLATIALLPFWGLNKELSKRNVFHLVWIFLATQIIITFLNIRVFETQEYNWVGKGSALLFQIILVLLLGKAMNLSEWLTGVKAFKFDKIVIICSLYFCLRLYLYIVSGEATWKIDIETLIFQATLPGIQEEFLFRGIILGLINQAFVNPTVKIFRVHVKLPSIIISSLLFSIVHSVTIIDFNFTFNSFRFFQTVFESFLFTLLVAKYKSIIPSIFFHNLLNVMSNH